MFNWFKRKPKPDPRFAQPLSPEADQFVAAALEEYGQKERALERIWRLSAVKEYALNDQSGCLHVKLTTGAAWEADAQILGSFNEADQTWQWAWGNTDCAELWARDSKVVAETGRRLGIWFLHELPMMVLPGAETVAHCSALGLKITDSAGWFEARSGPIVIFVMLKNLRWVSTDEHAAAAAAVRDTEKDYLIATPRLIKEGREDMLPEWLRLLARSEVTIISIEQGNPANLMLLGPKDDKNNIVVFTDPKLLAKALDKREHVLFPIALNGKAVLEQARDQRRSLILNPTDPAVAFPIPAKMVPEFLKLMEEGED